MDRLPWRRFQTCVDRYRGDCGVSENAVKSQIWIGVSVDLLVAILKKELGLSQSLHQILQIFSLTQFEKIPIFSMFETSGVPTFATKNVLTF